MPKNEFDFLAWKPVFEEHVRKSPRAKAGWERLVKKGCNPDVLARELAYACDCEGSPGSAQFVGEDDRGECERILKRAEQGMRRLEEGSRDVEELLGEAKRLALSKAVSEAVKEAKETAEFLKELMSRKGETPTLYLVGLTEHTRKYTGKPRYREICDLLAVAYSAFGEEDYVVPGEEALRKAVDRFKRDNPERVTDPEKRIPSLVWAAILVFIFYVADFFKKHSEGDGSLKTDVPAPPALEPQTSTPSTSPPSAEASPSFFVLSDEDKRRCDELLKAAAAKFPADKEPESGPKS